MNAPTSFVRIVNRLRYDVAKSTLIAHDAYWDGNNLERNGRNTFLYRTARGLFFTVRLSQWQGERGALEPISQESAIRLYEGRLSEHEVPYSEAFPDVEVEDA